MASSRTNGPAVHWLFLAATLGCVLMAPTASAQDALSDTIPPVVVSTTPANGAIDVSASTTISAVFSEALNPATVSGATVVLRDASDLSVAATIGWNSGTQTIGITPTAPLAPNASYTVLLRGASSGSHITDVAGNALAVTRVWTFRTAGPAPDVGPGGPILVITSPANPFTRYYAEILRAEGLNAFAVLDLSAVGATVLANYDVAILGEMPLTGAQVSMLTTWVNNGGNLIAMRPASGLSSLLGLTPVAGTLSNRYLHIDTSTGPGKGLVDETIQYHGASDRYTTSGATAIATLFSNASTPTVNPAVTLRDVGANGGQAVAFTYDLARSVVYTRQGNPAWAGQERDGVNPIRSDDLFFGAAPADSQSDWVDFNKIAIPQADEQQRLLANLILQIESDRKPLPRFWYLPQTFKAAVVMTGDNHGSFGMQPRFDTYLSESPGGCSLADWGCVRATGYLYSGPPFTNEQAVRYDSLGFEVGVHMTTGCQNWTAASLDSSFVADLATFATSYPDAPAPTTNRTHCIAWSDWATQPKVERDHGIRFDANYYYYPGSWIQDRPGLFTGSGMAMRFADLDGTMIDCYQANTQMTDESGQTYPANIDSLLNRAVDPRGYYGMFVTNLHFDTIAHPSSDAVVAAAQARGVPVVSARQMLRWLDGRNGSSFTAMAWSGNTLSFTVNTAAGADHLTGMLPLAVPAGDLASITRNGTGITWTEQVIKGVAYAMFPATPGNYAAHYNADVTPPQISAVVAAPGTIGTSATVTWTTDERASSRVDYGTSAGSLGSSATVGGLVTAHSVLLTGLTPTTTYYYRVTSADVHANASTAPQPPGAPSSFTTPATPCNLDDVVADFAQGSNVNTVVTDMQGGEVTLAVPLRAEFSALPPTTEWQGFAWDAGGTASVSGGQLALDGERLVTEVPGFGPGSSFEFVATFRNEGYEHAGFSSGGDAPPNEMFTIFPWALFSTGPDGANLRTRCWDGATTLDYVIPGSWLGAPHRYRIDWRTSTVSFWVDGTLVRTENIALSGQMRAGFSDFTVGGQALAVDWAQVLPFATSGVFTSRVIDSGTNAYWGTATWASIVPAGTTLALSARKGNSATPDASWTPFVSLPSSGSTVGGNSRYLQYRATMSTSDPVSTPVLGDFGVACTLAPDVTPPVISDIVATPGPSGTNATITWSTDEGATSRVDYGSNASGLTLNASVPGLATSHTVPLTGLSPGLTYYFRVTSRDASSNSATSPQPPAAPLSFATPPAVCFVDDVTADFASGQPSAQVVVSEAGGGEVILGPTTLEEFSGLALPPNWSAVPWHPDGSVVVAGGTVTVDGNCLNPDPYGANPGTSLEFVATFAATASEHVGFGAGNHLPPNEVFNTSPLAMFSTGDQGTSVLTRVWDGGAFRDFVVSASLLGSAHRYRIDWNVSSVDFYVDGALVHTEVVTLSGPMRPAISDFAAGGGAVVVDWIRVSPYTSPGTFTSRVRDAGTPVYWVTGNWTASTPAGTSLSVQYRTGNTPVPDGSWSAFVTLPSSGSSIAVTSRYLQYRANLATTDLRVTPALRSASFECGALPTHSITTTTSAGGTIAPGGIVTVDDGGTQAFTITPGTGFRTLDVRVDGVSAGPVAGYTFTNVIANHTLSASFADTLRPTIHVTFPNGGEHLEVGTTRTFTWSTIDNGPAPRVDLLLSRDGGATYPEIIAYNIPNLGSYQWVVSGPGTAAGANLMGNLLRVVARDTSGNVGSDDSDNGFEIFRSGTVAAGIELPTEFALASVSPNPASHNARISFAVPVSSRVRLSVIDTQGRRVAELANGAYGPGRYDVVWRRLSGSGGPGPGVYFVRFEAGGRVFIRRIVVVS